MKENQVAKRAQTIYARSMPAVAPSREVVSRVPAQEIAKAHIASKIAEGDVSKNVEQNKKAKEKAKEFAKELADGEEITLDPRAEKARADEARRLHREGKLEILDVLPGDAGALSIIGKFLGEISGKTLDEINEHILIFLYLQLRLKAENAGDRAAPHLEPLKAILVKKGIFNLDALFATFFKTLTVQRFWRGEEKAGAVTFGEAQKRIAQEILPKSGGAIQTDDFTDPVVRRAAESIQDQIGVLGGGNDARGEKFDVLNNRYGEVQVMPGVTNEDERRTLLRRISEAMNRAHEVETGQREQRRGGFYGERLLTAEDKSRISQDLDDLVAFSLRERRLPTGVELRGEAIDYYFNRIFDQANANARDEFGHAMGQVGSLEHQNFTTELFQMRESVESDYADAASEERALLKTKREILSRFIEKYDNEFNMRELLHNLFFIAETGGEFKDFASYAGRFSSHLADQAFLGSPEVEAALRVRENVLYQFKREHNGMIPPELVSYDPRPGGSQWEEKTKEILEQMNHAGMFAKGNRQHLEEWEIMRAMSISRGLGMGLLRFPEIIAECPLYGPPDSNQSQYSLPWEKLVWDLNPLDHKIKRYKIGKAMGAVIYAAKNRGQNRNWHDWWNKKELEDALALNTVSAFGTMHGKQRMVDMRNLWHTGGPFTHTSWRPYDSALEENRDNLRELLKRNPGLAIGTQFNSYENKGQGARKWAFINDPSRAHLPKAELLQLWIKESAQGESEAKGLFESEEKRLWAGAVQRVPHVVVRILTDEANGLMSRAEAKRLLDDIYGQADTEHARSELESDLVLAKEHMLKRRRDAIAQGKASNPPLTDEEIAEQLWTPEQDRLIEDDFTAGITGANAVERQARAQHFFNKVTELVASDSENLGKLINMSSTNGYPFALTTEDIPWSEFYFGQTGGRGYFTRKINDALADAEADDVLVDMLKSIRMMKGPEDIVAKLYEIFRKAEVHSADFAQQGVENLAIGIIRLFQKDGITKIPVFGEIKSLFNKITHKGDSFAEQIYGSKAPAWDNDDIYNFTEQLRGILDFDQIQRIRKETGSTFLKSLIPRSKVGLLYILPAFLLYSFMEKLIKEK